MLVASEVVPIAHYEWAIGTTSGATNIQNYTTTGISGTTASASGLSLSNGQTYYVSVRAVDNLGQTGSAATSDGVTVDTTAPAITKSIPGTTKYTNNGTT